MDFSFWSILLLFSEEKEKRTKTATVQSKIEVLEKDPTSAPLSYPVYMGTSDDVEESMIEDPTYAA